MDNNIKNNEQNNPSSASISIGGSEYIREKVKSRPINRRKLIRRTILTLCMAVLFGLVSCITLLVLEPIINKILNPEEEPAIVSFPEETEEIDPEDMYYDNMEMMEAEIMESENQSASSKPHDDKSSQPLADDNSTDDATEKIYHRDYLMDYTEMYNALQQTGAILAKSMVRVTVNSNGTDIFDNIYNITGETSGLCVAFNGLEYLILTNYNLIENADEIYVRFNDNTTSIANLKEYDKSTGLCVLAVHISRLSTSTKNTIAIATLGRSNVFNLIGMPIVAIGSPAGVNDSTMYGIVTSIGNDITTLDSRYKTLTTDIYGSQDAFGFISDLNGSIIGVINQNFSPDGCKNLITALGISELKLTVERMSNKRPRAILGLYGADINEDELARSIHDITGDDNSSIKPVNSGMFIRDIERDSPAMAAGIQVGDILIKINDTPISNLYDYAKIINSLYPDSDLRVAVLRLSPEGYTEIEYNITLASQ